MMEKACECIIRCVKSSYRCVTLHLHEVEFICISSSQKGLYDFSVTSKTFFFLIEHTTPTPEVLTTIRSIDAAPPLASDQYNVGVWCLG